MPASVNPKLAAIMEKLDISNPDHDALHGMLASAKDATNGAPDKMAAMAESLGQVAFFLAREKLNEPERHLQIAQACAASCPARASFVAKSRRIEPGDDGTRPAMRNRLVASIGALKIFDRSTAAVLAVVAGLVYLILSAHTDRKERAELEKAVHAMQANRDMK